MLGGVGGDIVCYLRFSILEFFVTRYVLFPSRVPFRPAFWHPHWRHNERYEDPVELCKIVPVVQSCHHILFRLSNHVIWVMIHFSASVLRTSMSVLTSFSYKTYLTAFWTFRRFSVLYNFLLLIGIQVCRNYLTYLWMLAVQIHDPTQKYGYGTLYLTGM